MKKKEFKSESKKLLDMMINSVYTNKDIFLRELISNASDALDKLYYCSLTDKKMKFKKEDLIINIELDKEKRTLVISDNGCGMSKDELENNLGTIAKSGSLDFKNMMQDKKNTNIIGQFGVGFYSAFMVSKRIEVVTHAMNDDQSYIWESDGPDGYTITEANKETIGTVITLYLKDNTDDEKYDQYLDEYKIKSLIKKYSDYITYPIKMKIEKPESKESSVETINSMIPLWNKDKSKITAEEYNNFYIDKFNDYNNPLKTIHYNVEGLCSYRAILFIPSKAPYDFYTKEYKKGLQLYSKGVLIMENCEELLPDYFSFVKGIVDSDDLALNLSREVLQQDHKVLQIAKSIESKIIKELINLLKEDRKTYIELFKEFGVQIKYGIYNNFGMDKEKLQDLLIFHSATKNDFVTLKEYVLEMKSDQDSIYYACGETRDKVSLLPQVEQVKKKDFDILYLTDYVDEFTVKALIQYDDKKFMNVGDAQLDLDTKEEQEELKKFNDDSKDILEAIKKCLPEVKEVKYTNKLINSPVCLSTTGEVSIEMEKVLNKMPGNENKINAETILEINKNHPIVKKIEGIYKTDPTSIEKYAKVLYASSRLIEGLTIENPMEIANIITEMMAK